MIAEAHIIEFWGVSTEAWSAIGTIVSAVVAAVGLLVAWMLYRITRKQNLLTETVQRAYISVEPVGVVEGDLQPNLPIGIVRLKNGGNLPATDLVWDMSVSEPTEFRHFKPVSRTPVGSSITLAAKGEMLINAYPPEGCRPDLSLWTLDHRPKQYIYVFGTVTYKDGFRTPRETRFCHRYGCHHFVPVSRDAKLRKIPADGARIHERGNSAS